MRRFIVLAILCAEFVLPLPAQDLKVESYQGRNVAAGEILVRFRAPDAAASRAAAMSVAARDADLVRVEPVGTTGVVLLRSSSRSAASLLDAYVSRSDVLYAEPNYLWHAAEIPNDRFFPQQWGLKNTGARIGGQAGTEGADIAASGAWDLTPGSRSIVVAVMDTGVAYGHPDLAVNMWSAPTSFSVSIGGQTIVCPQGTHGFNFIAKTCDPQDEDGHGTHVAGIIGAAGNNGFGVSGVNRETSIMALKFLDATGSGVTSDAIEAMEFAIQVKAHFGAEANVRILSNSWSGGEFSQALLDEIRLAGNAANNMLFVAAAGNGGADNDTAKSYPANFGTDPAPDNAPTVISVAATTNNDGLASFSNFGAASVHIGAPGASIFSTSMSGTFGFKSGTSMAAAVTAGAAAMVLAGCGSLSTAQLKNALLASVDAIPALTGRTITGGRLNVFNALNSCGAQASASFSLAATQGFNVTGPGSSVLSAVSMTPSSDDAGTVELTLDAPEGISASLGAPTLVVGGSTTLTVTVGEGAAPGIHVIHVNGASGGTARQAGISVLVVPVLALGEFLTGTLASDDQPDPLDPAGLADLYQITLGTATTMTVDLLPLSFNGVLTILNTDGAILFSNDGAGIAAQITASLAAGTYLIRVSTGNVSTTGSYRIYVNGPILNSIDPQSGRQGSVVAATLLGSRFLAGMTIDAGVGIGASIVDVSGATATATLTIGAQAALGLRSVKVTTVDGASNPVIFNVTPSFPILSGISPGSGLRGATIDVTLTGTSFFAPMTVSSIGLAASNINVLSSTKATATFVLGSVSGTYGVFAATPGGTSGSFFYTVLPFTPTLASIIPASGKQNSSFNVTLTGTEFETGLTINAGSNVFVTNLVLASSTLATATLNIDAAAALGNRNVTVSNPGGTSGPVTFTVVFPNPILSAITPDRGLPGATVIATLTGSSFKSGLVVNLAGAGANVVVSNVSVIDAGTAIASIAIAANAAFGAYPVTVTTSDGASTGSVPFIVVDPTLPDLTVGISHAGIFAAGFNEAYAVAVSNIGLSATVGGIALSGALPAGVSFVSGIGAGWLCSALGQNVSCVHAAAMQGGEQSALTLNVAVSGSVTSPFALTLQVSGSAEITLSNNSATDPTMVDPTPSPGFVFTPSTLVAGQQAQLEVRLANLFPHDVTGSVTMVFASNAAIPVDDPAIQFATGGRLVAFVIPANTLEARFAGNAAAGPIGFQTGTVAGTLTFRGALQAGTAQTTFQPTVDLNSLTIPNRPPAIRSVQAARSSSDRTAVIAEIALSSTMREVTALSLQFNTSPSIQPSCGSTPGCSVQGSTVTLNVKALFDAWFASDVTFGSLSTLRLPMAIQGTIHGSVMVTLRNSQGASNAVPFTLP